MTITTARNTFGQKARELAALEEAKQKEESATADLERLTRRETDLASQLGDAAAAPRDPGAAGRAEAATALKEVEERAAGEWWAAGAREAELASQLADAE